MSRQCGSCTACCQGWLQGEIEGFRMKPGRPCQHCTETGCDIYERRPVNPCRTFNCGWVSENSPLPEEFRPDQCGVIIRLNHRWQGQRVHFAIPTREQVPKEVLEFLVKHAQKTWTPLVWVTNEFKDGRFVRHHGHGFGPQDFVNAVKKHMQTAGALRF